MTDLAAVGVSAEVQEQLAAEIRAHFATISADGELVDAVSSAERRISVDRSWGREAQAAYADTETARAELLQALWTLVDDAREILPTGLQPYVDRAVANAGLDSPYRLLDITWSQREAIVGLQRERDRVLRDARQWHRPARLEAARAAFAAAAEPILTTAQQAELAQFQASIAANLDAVLDREVADYPDSDETEGQVWLQPKSAPRRIDSVAPILARWVSRLRATLDRFITAYAGSPVAIAR